MAIVGFKEESCIKCGLCARACSIDVIRMDKESGAPVALYPQDCMLCEMCLMVCPKDAVIFTPEKEVDVLLSWG